jgi:hypothetical protein
MMARFGWLLGKGLDKSSAPRKRPKVRLGMERLEDRAVPSNYWLGHYTSPGGYYGAGTQRVTFFAEQVDGNLTASNATAAWSTAMGLSLGSHGTLSTNAEVLDRTTSQHFMLIGWENLNTHMGGWLAAKYDFNYSTLVTSGPWWNRTTTVVTHSTMDWMSNGGQGRKNVEGPFTMNYTTNGYHLGLYVSPDSSGNIHASFNPPS